MTSPFRSFIAAGLACGLQALASAQQSAAAPAPAVAAALTPADAAFAAFQDLRKASPPTEGMDRRKMMLLRDEQLKAIVKAGLDFYEANPADPRRWDVVQALSTTTPIFIQDFVGETSAMKIDEAAKAAWQAKNEALQQAMAAATDVPPVPREAMDWAAFAKSFRAATQELKNGKPVDWAAFRPRFDAHVAKYLQLDTATRRADDYLGALERNVPGAAEAEWAHLKATTPSEALRAQASAQLARIELLRQPVDLAFTAVDGRAVDMKALRGKVVLVDFWATWCGPCIAELPNVKAVYSKYHDKGFEIVGISLDRATDRQKLLDFVAKEEMLWPQHYDGKYWQNEYAVKYGIRGIPAMFLIDQNGRIVTTSARGPALEAQVARLLAK